MEIRFIKELAKKASNEVLFDAIYNKQFSDDELVLFNDEVKARGLTAQFTEFTKTEDLKKYKIKAAVTELPKERLFDIPIFNVHKFSDEELTPFRNEISARGLDKEFAEVTKVKAAGDLEFKKAVLDDPKDPIDLMEKFNAYNDKKYPHIAARIKTDRIKKVTGKSLTGIIAGIVLLVGGAILTAAMEGGMIFYGAITVGLILIVRGIVAIAQA